MEWEIKQEGVRVSRRTLLLSGAAASIALAVPFHAIAQAEDEAPVTQTTAGPVRGSVNGSVLVFKGVPYGAPTGDEDRFLPPKPPKPWTEVRNATAYGSRFPQPDYPPTVMPEEGVDLDKGPQGQDSLYLNIWTSGLDSEAKRPVMVWFHGGGYSSGSGGSIRYDGTNLAAKRDVVLVTLNHRLNAFGFLHLAEIGGEKYARSGNAGMLDIVQALEWVRDNVANFGGDPGNVTIFGESGGAGKVLTLMAMPAAKGLFHRVIAQSGNALRHATPEQATETTRSLLKELGIAEDNLDALKKVPHEKIIAAMIAAKPPLNFGPVVDGDVLPRNPFTPDAPPLSADIPLMVGSNMTESTFFTNTPLDPIDEPTLFMRVKEYTKLSDEQAKELIALYRKGRPAADNTFIYQLISSDWWVTANTILQAERKAQQGGAPVFVYRFEKTTPVRNLKSPHTLEIAYAFDNVALSTAITGEGADKHVLADKVSAAWTAFARNGDPNVEGMPQWAPFTAEDRAVMVLGDEPRGENDPNGEELALIGKLRAG